MASTAPFTTTVHPFESPTASACAYELGSSSAKNAYVFIGGLGDGPHTVPYARAIAKALEDRSELSYSVFEFRLTSSFNGFGFARLADDVADISALVKYLRSIGKEKVVLSGHSTGCQDIMEYNSPSYPETPAVDGFVLQAPVADRGAIEIELGRKGIDESVKVAKNLIDSGKGHERMPKELIPDFFPPISAQRWYALAAVDGEDNYFSPDLTKDVAGPYWSRISKPLLILQSGEDEFMPPSVDKNGLVREWKTLCRPGIASDLSGSIPGANHRVEQPDSEKWLVETVVKFLGSLQ
ncbi:hypothetical protein SUNI508_02309 [Seiridium unicorne]|uniref:Dolichol-phosphate mannosyltransferase n=1 Tax=Seiridium unicorne TaxID=138068 RepID=A0ABR2UIB6_9PEZI